MKCSLLTYDLMLTQSQILHIMSHMFRHYHLYFIVFSMQSMQSYTFMIYIEKCFFLCKGEIHIYKVANSGYLSNVSACVYISGPCSWAWGTPQLWRKRWRGLLHHISGESLNLTCTIRMFALRLISNHGILDKHVCLIELDDQFYR